MGEESRPTFGARLRQLRKERRLSLADVAYRARGFGAPKMDASYLGRLERDEKYPSLTTLRAVCLALELEPTELPEYRLAAARRLLDERAVGLERALGLLNELAAVLEPEGGPALARFLAAIESLEPLEAEEIR